MSPLSDSWRTSLQSLNDLPLEGLSQLCGFDIIASKIASFFIGIGLLVPVVRATSWLPIGSIVLTVSHPLPPQACYAFKSDTILDLSVCRKA